MTFMNSTTNCRKPVEKATSDNRSLHFDLLSQLTHMSVLSLGGIQRDQVFSSSERLGLRTEIFFSHVHRMVKAAGMEYSQALKLVAARARSTSIKSLLLRFAAAISSGESERDFVIEERKTTEERYKNEYEKDVENLRKWTEAYAAVLVSVTLIMVVSMVATMMSSTDISFVGTMAVTVAAVTGLGAYLIYGAAPIEKIIYDGERAIPAIRRISRKSLLFLLPLGVIGLALGQAFDLFSGTAIALICIGSGLLPAGLTAMKDDLRVRQVDEDLHTFLRSTGNIAGSINSDLNNALEHIDVGSMGSLSSHINRLRLRIATGLPTDVCWSSFQDESGSELVNRSTRMMLDGVEAGARPGDVGAICSGYASAISQLRVKRRMIATTFSFLTVPMHGTMIFILVFVSEILDRFRNRMNEATEQIEGFAELNVTAPGSLAIPSGFSVPGVQDLSSGLFMFQSGGLGSMDLLVIGVILTLTVANALAPKFAAGGSNLKIAFHLSATCFVSGIVLALVPMMADRLFVT